MGVPFQPTIVQTIELRSFRKPPTKHVTIDKDTIWPPGANGDHYLPQGLALGLNADTGKYHAIRGTEFDANEAAGQTILSVARTDVFEVGDNVKACAAAAFASNGYDFGVEDLGAITAIDAAAGTITVTTALTGSFLSGDYVYVAPVTDYGQEIAVAILARDVQLYSEAHVLTDAQGVQVLVTHDGGDPWDATKLASERNLSAKARSELASAGFRFV